MYKELLSVLSLSLLVSLAPSCCCKKETKSSPKKTVTKIDMLDRKVLDDASDDEDQDSQTDAQEDEEIVTKF